MKIPMTVLTYKRPTYLEKTLKSFFELNKANLECFLIIILIQGGKDEETEKVIDKYRKQFYRITYSDTNLGFSGGYNFLMEEAIKLKLPFVIHLEDDFVSNEPLVPYLPELTELLKRNNDIGYIRLRTIKEKVWNTNVISGKKLEYKKATENIVVGNAHFTTNPTIAKLSVIKKIIPMVGELDAQQKYHKLDLKTGQLLVGCFSHIGIRRVKNWII